jgi:Mrp family chromosome partitioning ATPase
MLMDKSILELRPIPSGVSGLDLVTAGSPQTESSALVGSEKMGAFIDQARERYDWIVVDAPPALPLPDASALSTHCDGVILVCASERSRLREIQAVTAQIQAVGGTMIGAVLNRVNMSRHHYYYGRSYSNYYGDASGEEKG